MKSHRQPAMPFNPFILLWMDDCRNPEKRVPASPEAVNMPLRFANSAPHPLDFA
jgi:hypothetical protein